MELDDLPAGPSKAFRLRFSDGHVGHFAPPRPKGFMWQQGLAEQPRSLWHGQELRQQLVPGGALHFDFEGFKQEAMVMSWIEAMHTHGVALVSGALGWNRERLGRSMANVGRFQMEFSDFGRIRWDFQASSEVYPPKLWP